jgi:eukaryotic-like serine/threonine-protein kinase
MFTLSLDEAARQFPDYNFCRALTPSAQKAAFHVRDRDGNDLCLKIVSPDYERERLDREIRAMQSITHPNVVRLIEYTFSSRPGLQRHYIIEEFIAGQDLADHLRIGEPWEHVRASTFFAEVCDGLSALRQQGIVHRDIKPHNIRVRGDGRPVIIDFGLARHLALPDLTQTVDGARIGTPTYFAPEQFDGNKRDIDHRTDLFAVGILLFEALTGSRPFFTSPTMTIGELRDAVCQGSAHLRTPAFLALNERMRLLLSKLLEKDRARRPADAAQVAVLLRKFAERTSQ